VREAMGRWPSRTDNSARDTACQRDASSQPQPTGNLDRIVLCCIDKRMEKSRWSGSRR